MDHEEYRTRTNALTTEALTLRDQFAAAALTGIIANMAQDASWTHDLAATHAYHYADAMIRARNLTKETP